MEFYDVVIIGAGPAGLTAALYLLRAGKSVVIFEKEAIGGQMARAPWIENYPGVNGMQGVMLAEEMYNQLSEYKYELCIEEATHIDVTGNNVYVMGEFGTKVRGDYLIIATGGSPITLDIPGINKPHVHYCATCDGALYENKEVAVVGDANSALQYAVELAGICEKVHICAIGDRLYGEQVWIDRVTDCSNIEIHYNFDTAEITDYGICSGDGQHILIDGVFIAIGYKPCLPDVSKIYCPRNDKGYVRTSFDLSTENRVYFIGDVREKPFRQIISAANDGMMAALSILRK